MVSKRRFSNKRSKRKVKKRSQKRSNRKLGGYRQRKVDKKANHYQKFSGGGDKNPKQITSANGGLIFKFYTEEQLGTLIGRHRLRESNISYVIQNKEGWNNTKNTSTLTQSAGSGTQFIKDSSNPLGSFTYNGTDPYYLRTFGPNDWAYVY